MLSEVKEKTIYNVGSKELIEYAKKQLSCLLIKKQDEGYSQSYLAKILGVDQPKISQYAALKKYSTCGNDALSLSKILRLMELLDTYVIIDTSEKEIEKIFKIIKP